MNAVPDPLAVAFDHSGPGLSVACAPADTPAELLLRRTVPGDGRAAAALLPRLLELLAEHGCELRNLRDWTVGTGPGGFTGLRVLAAFVAGVTAGRDGVRARGVPSALAMAAATAQPDDETVAVLQPRRDGSVLACRSVREGENWRLDSLSTVASREELIRLHPARQRLAALASQREALSAWGSEVVFLEEFTAEQLLRINPGDWRRESLFEVVYARPAATPKKG